MKLLHVFFYANLLTLGLTAEKVYIDAAMETVKFVKGLTNEIIDDAKKMREEIGKWRDSIEAVSEEQLEAYEILVARAADTLAVAEDRGQNIIQNMLRRTNQQMKVLDKAFAKENPDEALELINCVKTNMLSTLNTSISLLAPVIQQVMDVKQNFLDVTTQSKQWADKITTRMTDKQLEADKADIKAKVYGSCASGAAFGLIGLGAAYGAAIPLVNKKIAEWEKTLATAKSAIENIRSKLLALGEKSQNLHTCAGAAATRMLNAQSAMISAQDVLKDTSPTPEEAVIYWKEFVMIELENLKVQLEAATKLENA